MWRKGSANNAPDALSRSPTLESQQEDMLAENDEHNVPDLRIHSRAQSHTSAAERREYPAAGTLQACH